MKLAQFDYHLPKDQIAQRPVEPRDQSKLLVLYRHSDGLEHKHFYDLPEVLRPSDVLIRNNSKVMTARLFCQKTTGGLVELLLIKAIESAEKEEVWEVLSKPSLKVGQVVTFKNSSLNAQCVALTGYTRQMKFNQSRVELMKSIEQVGKIPIPPYIHWEGEEEKVRDVYQTTYAKILGSVAAPTAGLHFTPELDEKIKTKGIAIEEVTLHVGLGTFLPVKTEEVTEHHMHKEWYELSQETADRLNQYKKEGRRIVAVGTTTVRTLETLTNESGELKAGVGETQIFIYPPYKFRFVDALITNFHLPKSTLLMLISALVSQPNTQYEFENFETSSAGKAYQAAVQEKYRFFSFGDAMLIQ
ncbi:MAG: tRNA preQ1(34) S-adenosylmethionine ribosyltransferase-isomerase QueA [Patescibacteria group bacterium]